MYATIIDRNVTLHDGTPTLDQMQDAVGGLIETAERYDTNRKNITIDVYCNEEGLLEGLDYTYHTRAGQCILGNLVLTASNNKNGKTVPATREELAMAILDMGFSIG